MNEFQSFIYNFTCQFLSKMHVYEQDNWDQYRFKNEPNQQKGSFPVHHHANNFLFFLQHYPHLFETYQSLEDEPSKKWLQELLLFKLLGHNHVKLPNNNPAFRAAFEDAKKHCVGKSDLQFRSEIDEELSKYEVEFCGKKLRLNCWLGSVVALFYHQQYYFSRNGIQIAPEPGDYVIDGGACLGDTSLAFAASVGEKGRVFSFDIVPGHLNVMKENFSINPNLSDRIDIVPKGLSDKSDKMNPTENGLQELTPWASINTPGVIKDLISIDDFVLHGEGAIPKMDFIKMDIEGAELAALQGAEKTLRLHRPKLAISMYHKNTDFFELPRFLHSLSLGYRLYIDHHTMHAEETVLYADAR